MNNTKQTPQQTNIAYLMQSKKDSKLEEHHDIKIVTFLSDIKGTDKPAMQIFRGKQKKAFVNFYFQSFERREQLLNETKQRADSQAKEKAKEKAEKAAFIPDFKVGDIFCSSWGWEQTNVDFYQVIKKVGKHTAVFREVTQQTVEGSLQSGGMACDVLPEIDSFVNDTTYQKRITKYGAKFSSYQQATKHHGMPKYKSWYA